MEIPKWFDSDVKPCPCGRPPFGTMIMVRLEEDGTMLYHEECLKRMTDE